MNNLSTVTPSINYDNASTLEKKIQQNKFITENDFNNEKEKNDEKDKLKRR